MEIDDAENRAISHDFINSLKGEDLLGVVIRSHLHIEKAINSLLAITLSCEKDDIDFLALSFNQKIKILKVATNSWVVVPTLKIINRIRNKVAHENGFELTEDDIVKAVDSLSIHHQFLLWRSSSALFSTKVSSREDFLESLTINQMYAGIALVVERQIHWHATPVEIKQSSNK